MIGGPSVAMFVKWSDGVIDVVFFLSEPILASSSPMLSHAAGSLVPHVNLEIENSVCLSYLPLHYDKGALDQLT